MRWPDGPRVETFYGKDGVYPTPYLTRLALTRWLSVHVFHRGDADPDPHDHVQAFVTLPLTSYVEQVYDPKTGREWFQVVRAWRLHYRPARYAHRVLGPFTGHLGEAAALFDWDPSGGIVTVVLWVGRRSDRWGFWALNGRARRWVHWRTYIYGEAARG